MAGWIKLHRNIADWEWWDDDNALKLLVHLLVSVNYRDKKWHGIIIPAGSIILSWDTLSERIRLTPRQCRTAMDKLESSGEVSRKLTGRSQLVSLTKWEKLQGEDDEDDREMTYRSQGDDREMTPTKERKKERSKKTNPSVKINFDGLLDMINKTFGREFKVINKKTRNSFAARLTEGYTKDDINTAIIGVSKDNFHIENNFKHATVEYFSRSRTLDLHSSIVGTEKSKGEAERIARLKKDADETDYGTVYG
jgi:uncharacterized phage protein (TIGR02220 family)|tara:strand:+ start:190 stop:945 length:756 start_codon:yes stop_codon:yes gene_type:complete